MKARQKRSGLEGVVGFAVVGEVADAVHGVFEEGRDGEDREANGRAGKRADEEEREAGGFRLDFSDGEITFRHCIHLGDAPLDPESVRCALALVCYAVDHALPQLAAVALGQSTYGEALARDGKQGGDN